MRIAIIGNAGSGKSTLTKQLAKHFNAPAIHLDRELLRAGFEVLPPAEMEAKHNILCNGDSWIMDGQYRDYLEYRAKRADLVIFMNVPRYVSLTRVLKRAKRGGQPKETVPDGAEDVPLKLSFVRWILKYDRRKKSAFAEEVCNRTNTPFVRMPNVSTNKQVQLVFRIVEGG